MCFIQYILSTYFRLLACWSRNCILLWLFKATLKWQRKEFTSIRRHENYFTKRDVPVLFWGPWVIFLGCNAKLAILYVLYKKIYTWRWSHSYESFKLLTENCHQQQCKNGCIYRQEIFSDKHIDSCLTFPVDVVPVFQLLFKQVNLKMLKGGLTLCHKTLYKVPRHKYVRLR